MPYAAYLNAYHHPFRAVVERRQLRDAEPPPLIRRGELPAMHSGGLLVRVRARASARVNGSTYRGRWMYEHY